MKAVQPFYRLDSESVSLVLDCRGNAPALLYFGRRLDATTTAEMLAVLATRQEAQASVESEAPVALSPELGAGFGGTAGLRIHREGRHWGVFATIESVDVVGNNQLRVASRCGASQIDIEHRLVLDRDVLAASTEIGNRGDTALQVEQCHAPCIPVAGHLDQILSFEGSWANEFQLQRMDRFAGSYVRENHAGRTSHDLFPGVVLHAAATNETAGEACGFHFGWSGNHRTIVEEQSSGRAYVLMGEAFHPGELSLEPGERYRTPVLYASFSGAGFSGLSRNFHDHVRSRLTDPRTARKTKLVHFNTWEAVYFDVSVGGLMQLADEAAAVGVERFVLDDGWFRGRNSESAGLGDWYVDDTAFPDGLAPLIEHVNTRGMEFGLWVEPEMVNPDSDLYRGHPDWVLGAAPAPPVMARNQLVLDLTRSEVRDYLFERLDALLTEYPITYLKWDMNRDLSQPGSSDGRAVTHHQTLAFYALVDRVRAAHPDVEIESCASGGARADYGVLSRTDRIWTSDSNDALDRLRIQRGFSYFFPAEVMGAHVGPETCHVTGRRLSMATRAAVAMFGDMGIEANLLEMGADEKAELADAIALHKQHRELLFTGDLVRLDTSDREIAFGIVSRDKQQALFSYALLESSPRSHPGRMRFHGLSPDGSYRLRVAWPANPKTYSRSILDIVENAAFSGDALMSAGMQLPILRPETVLVIYLSRVD